MLNEVSFTAVPGMVWITRNISHNWT